MNTQPDLRSVPRAAILLDRLDEIVFSLDSDSRLTYVNSAVRACGYTPDELTGVRVIELVHPVDRKRVKLFLEQLKSGPVPNGEASVKVLTADQTSERGWRLFRVRVETSNDRSETGSVPEAWGVATDITECYDAKRQIRRVEETYRTIFESAGDAVFILQNDRIVDCNAKTEILFGRPRHELIGSRPHVDLSPAGQGHDVDSETDGHDRIDAALRGREQIFQWTHTRGDGALFSAQISLIDIHIDTHPHVLAIARDVTAREEAVAAVRDSEQRFKTLAENVPVGFAYIDSSHTHQFVNNRFASIVGRPTQELVGVPVAELADAESRDNLSGRLCRTFEGHEERAEGQLVVGNPRLFSGRLVPDTDENGVVKGAFALLSDITEQRAMEDEITTSRNLFESIIESVSQGIAVMDRQGQVTYLNRAIRELTPNPAEEFVSRMPWEVSDCLKSVGAEEMTHRALDGEAIELEFSFTLGDQDRRIRANLNPLVSDGGRNLGAVLVMSDLTEVMSLRDQIAAVQKMDALGTLAGGIAHDMNNILTAVQGYLHLINSSVSVGEFHDVLAHSKEMQSALTRAGDLVRQIMTFSRRSPHEARPTQVHLLVNEAVKLLRASLSPNIEIVSDSTGVDALVMADPARLHQIMMNLGTNASHAMEASGGTLTISVDIVAESDQTVAQGLNPSRNVVICFSDTGVGIPRELLPRIFEPFFTTKQPGRGTGLGLSVVYGIVTEIGGAVEVDSVEGQGTEVRVLLPEHILEDTDTPTCEKPEAERPSTRSARVLFVDDEEALTELGAISLERLGHSVVSCTNGQTAFDMFSFDPDRFDLVVTDHIMPELLGHQLAVQIRQLRPDIPIVIATGTSEDYTQEHAEEAGFHYLPKPYTLDQLVGIASHCISQQAPERS